MKLFNQLILIFKEKNIKNFTVINISVNSVFSVASVSSVAKKTKTRRETAG
jgi:hypothetical protein